LSRSNSSFTVWPAAVTAVRSWRLRMVFRISVVGLKVGRPPAAGAAGAAVRLW
jgi:hypothetical protein